MLNFILAPRCGISKVSSFYSKRNSKFVRVSKHHAEKTCGRVEVKLHELLTSTLDGGEWSVSRSAALPQANSPR
jgi:hypothetical protein